MLKRVLAILEGEGASVATDKDYEQMGREYLRTNFLSLFGLNILPGLGPQRPEGEIPATPRDNSTEWDFRVLCEVLLRAQIHRERTKGWLVYGLPAPGFYTPPPAADARQLSPLKPGVEVPKAHFVGIIEITHKDWSRNDTLFDRLESRLRISLWRARDASGEDLTITQVVAIIGIMSPEPYELHTTRKINSAANSSKWPLLKTLMGARRFVWVGQALEEEEVEEAGSGTAAGGSGSAAATGR